MIKRETRRELWTVGTIRTETFSTPFVLVGAAPLIDLWIGVCCLPSVDHVWKLLRSLLSRVSKLIQIGSV